MTADRRRPRWVYSVGAEPDARFTLANERTFLAWVRTALALLVGGVGIGTVGLPLAAPWETVIVALLLALGTVTPLAGWVGWARTERALRRGAPLPRTALPAVLATGVVLTGASLVIGLAAR